MQLKTLITAIHEEGGGGGGAVCENANVRVSFSGAWERIREERVRVNADVDLL